MKKSINRNNYSKHLICLCSLFLLGDTLIDLPLSGADDKTIFSYFVSVVITFLLLAVSAYFFEFLLNLKSNGFWYRFFAVITSFLVLAVGAESFARFTVFARKVMIPQVNELLVAALLLLTAYLIIKSKEKTLFKYSLLSFLMVTAVIVMFFIASYNEFEFENAVIYYLPDIKKIYSETVPYLIRISLPSCILPVFCRVSFNKGYDKQVFLGTAFGYILATLVILNSILIFGAELSGDIKYPYSAAISTVSVGYLFARMDGFSYFLGFSCTLIRISVCVITVKKLMTRVAVGKSLDKSVEKI